MNPENLFSEFVREFTEKDGLVEAFAIADGEKILFEHHFNRFGYKHVRNIYSHTKTFASTAVGIAVDEGLLSLQDRVSECFPEYFENTDDPKKLDITLEDVLTMRSGFGTPLLMGVGSNGRTVAYPDWLGYVLSHPLKHVPGTVFTYSNGDTYLAGRMLEKKTGVTLQDYIYGRYMRRAGISYPVWEHDPQGHTFPASSLYLNISDQLKLGQLYLNGGMLNGERIISEKWVELASTPKLFTADGTGYGYQIWIYPPEFGRVFRADGAYGQITAVLPEKGLAVSIQCPEYGQPEKTIARFNEYLRDFD